MICAKRQQKMPRLHAYNNRPETPFSAHPEWLSPKPRRKFGLKELNGFETQARKLAKGDARARLLMTAPKRVQPNALGVKGCGVSGRRTACHFA